MPSVLPTRTREDVLEALTDARMVQAVPAFFEEVISYTPYHRTPVGNVPPAKLRALVRDWIGMEYGSATNAFLSQLFEALTAEQVTVTGEPGRYFPCPCCGLRTLTERHDPQAGTGYDICPYCGWEDSGQDGSGDRDVASSPNGASMIETLARARATQGRHVAQRWPESGSSPD